MSALRIEDVLEQSAQIINFESAKIASGNAVSSVINGGAVATKIIKLPTAQLVPSTGAVITTLEGEVSLPILANSFAKTAGGYALSGIKALGTAGLYAVAGGVGAVTGLQISEWFKRENPELADALAWKTADKWLSEKLGFEYNQTSVPVLIDTETNKTYVPEGVIKPIVNMFYAERVYDKAGFNPTTTLSVGTVLDKTNLSKNLRELVESSFVDNSSEQYKERAYMLADTVQPYVSDGTYVIFEMIYDGEGVGWYGKMLLYKTNSQSFNITTVNHYARGNNGGVSAINIKAEEITYKREFYMRWNNTSILDTDWSENYVIDSDTVYRNIVYTYDNHGITTYPREGVEQVGTLPNISDINDYNVFDDYAWSDPLTHAETKWYPLVLGDTATQPNAQTGALPDTAPDILTDALVNAGTLVDGLVGTTPTVPTDTVTPPIPFIPTNTINNGFVGCFNLTPTEVRQFSEFLWSEGFLNTLKNLISDPIQTIISFHQIYATPEIGTEKVPIKCGYVTSTVNANKVTNQYITIDCGTIDLSEYYNSYSDYEPYTKTELFLPFIGIVRLNTNEIMNRQIKIEYKIDVFTGTCVANIYVNGALLYTYNGNCSVQLPLTGGSFAESIIGIVGGAFGGAKTGMATGSVVGAVGGALIGGATNTLNMFEVQRTGSLSANTGVFAPRKPYFIISRTNDVTPTNYQTFEGFPSSNFVALTELSGFTKITGVQINSVTCTEQEREMLLTLLNDGVIF